VGTDVVFLRQLIAQARPEDVAIGISTSGGSRNIITTLEEARTMLPENAMRLAFEPEYQFLELWTDEGLSGVPSPYVS